MKEGKLNWDDLKEIISENKGAVREEVRVHSGIGEDCSIIKFGDYECVISTDPITGADSNIGKLAVNINCNDIASCGVEPIGIMVTILAPEGATLEQIKSVMKEIGEEAKKLNIEILGGHTEVTSAVNKLIVSCTVIGKSLYGKAISTSGAKLGDDVVVTKYLAMEGSSILANDYEDEIKTVLTDEEIKTAKDYANDISVIKEGRLAGEFGVDSMHDITEGGVLGALWEMAEASQVGFKVFEKAMPISEVTKKICNKFNIDPLKFISSGSMLIVTQKGEALVKLMKQKNIKATIIGKITEKKGILVKDNIEIEVDPPERDELFNI